jgi:hypothetical protein
MTPIQLTEMMSAYYDDLRTLAARLERHGIESGTKEAWDAYGMLRAAEYDLHGAFAALGRTCLPSENLGDGSALAWAPDDYDPDQWLADVPEGWLTVFVNAANEYAETTDYGYEVTLGFQTSGTLYDPPEFVEQVVVERVGFTRASDARFAAQRHYERLVLMEHVNGVADDEAYAESLATDGCVRCTAAIKHTHATREER